MSEERSDISVESTTDTPVAVDTAIPETESTPEVPVVPPAEPSEADQSEVEPSEDDNADEAEESESAPAADTGDAEKKVQGRKKWSERVDKLTKERYETRARLAAAQEEIEKLKQEKETSTSKLELPAGAPERESYASDGLWILALSDWGNQERSKAEAQKQQQERDAQVLTTFYQRADKYEETHPGFKAAINSIPKFSEKGVADAVIAAVQRRENSSEVIDHIIHNPEIVYELDELNPIDAVAAIVELSVALKKDPSSPKPATKLAAPITPVGGSTRVARELGELDEDAYIAERRRQKQAAGHRR